MARNAVGCLVATIAFDLVGIPVMWALGRKVREIGQEIGGEFAAPYAFMGTVCDVMLWVLVGAIVVKMALLPRLHGQAKKAPPPMPSGWRSPGEVASDRTKRVE